LAESDVGYIIEGGNMMLIETPQVEAVSKFAYDVIKVQVKDYFDELEDLENDGDFDELRDNLM
jgi:hypothetical protein